MPLSVRVNGTKTAKNETIKRPPFSTRLKHSSTDTYVHIYGINTSSISILYIEKKKLPFYSSGYNKTQRGTDRYKNYILVLY